MGVGVYWIHLVNLAAYLSVFLSVGDMVSGTQLKFALEFRFQISYACCLCLWAEACWFSPISLSKWSPGGHIGFFGFRTITLFWLRISRLNFSGTSSVFRREPVGFQQCNFQNGCLAAILDFTIFGFCRWHGFLGVTQVCFGVSISNFTCMLFVAMGRSLYIVSDITFKMAA